MIWVTWRQHRGEAFIIGGVLAALAVVLVGTGRQIYDSFDALGVGPCLANRFDSNCFQVVRGFSEQYGFLRGAVPWLNLVPMLVAMLIGAPLVARELERGTHRMIWTQGVTRRRWLTVKLGLVLGGCLLAEAALIALLTWWNGPFARLGGNFSTALFDLEGTAPLAYMAFAVALAVAAGTLLRRTLPAMVLTIALFLGVRLPIDNWVRPHYQAPVVATYDLVAGDAGTRLNDWVLDDGFVNAQGQTADFGTIVASCDPSHLGLEKATFFQCAKDHGFQGQLTYQPAIRLNTFQAIETAIYLALTAALIGLTTFWVRRRVS